MSTIALVDDDHNILSSVSVVLEAESYRVITYSDGFSALKGFTASAPDLAILDINMSRMDVWSCCGAYGNNSTCR